MSIRSRYFTRICVWAAGLCGLVLIAAPGMATPVTGATVLVNTGGTGGAYSDTSTVTTPGASSAASASVGAATVGADGSHADASGAAFANFGTLGVAGSGNALTPPATPTTGVASDALASAFWDDALTPVPIAGSGLASGTQVIADLNLDLRFTNALFAFNNGTGFFHYEMVVAVGATVVLSACLVTDPGNIEFIALNCPDGVQSTIVGIPANNNDPLTIQLASIALPLTILQPFELSASLVFDGQCTSGPNDTQFSSCVFDGDALHTSNAFLQPLGDFTLVAASGHDYSLPAPPNGAPESGSLALMIAALVPAALSLRRRRATRAVT